MSDNVSHDSWQSSDHGPGREQRLADRHLETWIDHQLSSHPDSGVTRPERGESAALVEDWQDQSPEALLDIYQCLQLIDQVWGWRQEGTLVDGRYLLKRCIGRGGMGEVWEAEQQIPVKRTVALKFVRSDTGSESITSRFASERQFVAALEHPSIARMIDAGSSQMGELYLVMELVRGLPITRFCQRKQLDLTARIQLMISICEGVQHAHQRALIHRDLKPNNILVAEEHGSYLAKIIDFGLAKLIGQPEILLENEWVSNSDMELTRFGQRVGTLPYMSPEQLSQPSNTIDTRTDVYSLGVVFYELLTGRLPVDLDPQDFSSWDEAMATRRSQTVMPPSCRLLKTLRTSARASSAYAGQELDWIAAKALATEPGDRYASVQDFADDLQAFLSHQPLAAAPDRRSYRWTKRLQQHPWRSGLAIALMLAVVMGCLGTSWEWYQASVAQRSAERNLARSRQSSEILQGVFRDLDIDRLETEDEPIKQLLAKRLIRAIEQLESISVDEPMENASFQLQLAQWLVGLGYPDEAIAPCQSAVRELEARMTLEDVMLRDARRQWSLALQKSGQLQQARRVLAPVLEYHQLNLLDRSDESLSVLEQLAALDYADGDYPASKLNWMKAYQLRCEEFGSEAESTIQTAYGLAKAHVALFEAEEARPLLEAGLAYRRENYPKDHPETISMLTDLSWALIRTGPFGETQRSIELATEAFEGANRLFGKTHRTTYETQVHLGLAQGANGNLAEARRQLEVGVEGLRSTAGPEHPMTLMAQTALAKFYHRSGMVQRAIELNRSTLSTRRNVLPAGHIGIMSSVKSLVDACLAAGETELALELLAESVDDFAIYPAERVAKQGYALILHGQPEQAVGLLRELHESEVQQGRSMEFETVLIAVDLSRALSESGAHEEAVQWMQTLRSQVLEAWGPRTIASAIVRAQTGVVLFEAGQVQAGIECMEPVAFGRPLKRHDYLMAKLRHAYFTAGQDEALDRSLDRDAQSLRSHSGEMPEVRLQRAGDIAAAAIEFQRWGWLDSFLNSGVVSESMAASDQDNLAGSWSFKLIRFQEAIGHLAGGGEEAKVDEALQAKFGALLKHPNVSVPANRLRLSRLADAVVELYTGFNQPERVEHWKRAVLNLGSM